MYCSMGLQQAEGILVGLGGQRGRGAAQGDSRFSLVGEPSEVLDRTVGEGVKTIMKKNDGERRRSGALVCSHVIITVQHSWCWLIIERLL